VAVCLDLSEIRIDCTALLAKITLFWEIINLLTQLNLQKIYSGKVTHVFDSQQPHELRP
jgi:hypothetical protein